MRGEIFLGFGLLLTLSAGVLLIFSNISAISTDLVPSALKYTTVDTNSLGQALTNSDQTINVDNLYTTDSNNALGQSNGIRREYYFGQYSYCGTVESRRDGDCNLARDSQGHLMSRLDPYGYILDDTPADLKDAVRNLLSPLDQTFTASNYLRRYSAAAYWLIFLSAIFVGVSLITGIIPNKFLLFFAGIFSLISFLTLAVGASIITALVVKLRHINDHDVGVFVHYGVSLWLIWPAVFVLLLAIPFYFIS